MTEVLAFIGALFLVGLLAWGLTVIRFKVWDDREGRRTYGGYEPGPRSAADLKSPPRTKGAGA